MLSTSLRRLLAGLGIVSGRRCDGLSASSSHTGRSWRRLPANSTATVAGVLRDRHGGNPGWAGGNPSPNCSAKRGRASRAEAAHSFPSANTRPRATPIATSAPSPASACGAQPLLSLLTGNRPPVSLCAIARAVGRDDRATIARATEWRSIGLSRNGTHVVGGRVNSLHWRHTSGSSGRAGRCRTATLGYGTRQRRPSVAPFELPVP